MEKLNFKNDTQISMVWYENLDATSFIKFIQCKWSDLVELLSIPQYDTNKYIRGVALYGDVADETNIDGKIHQRYRKDKNILYRNIIVLDYDGIDDLKRLNDAFKTTLGNISWFWHTTFNHYTDSPRIRLFIPLNKKISPDEYRKYSKLIAKEIGFKVDEGSYQPSRVMALPVVKSKKNVFLKVYNDAPIIKVEQLIKLSKLYVEKNKSIIVKTPMKRSSEHWKEIAYGVADGERNNALTSLLGHLFNHHVDENIIYSFALLWNQSCKPPMKERIVNSTFKSVMKMHYNS
ncbi:primase alpha helix C-terminal domain-containing protein [Staphylococcus devriesei]|uniref:primase alpha helix C-terminal domain-containing protein n=1 Tax=Staphylococcus devriesei TaxID=586733 RepID=UPI001F2372C5|nr:primase alpha helix C-terminal domain-containing protein [Staphylococcus devriesei]MCE5090504.1 primase alpha helix C-terminal domain-containing protein [Staphylococcus devriesei]